MECGTVALFAAAATTLAACHGGRPAPSPTAIALPFASPAATPSPAPPWSAAERADVARRLSSLFTDDVFQSGSGLAVVAEDGSVLYQHRARVPVTPASTLKIVVAATALDLLGPAHRFETQFASIARPDASGILQGPLYVVGGGDPWLTANDVRGGIGMLKRSGVERIDGGLIVDDGAFSGPDQNARWDADDLSEDYAAATSAISLDQGTVEFDVEPGAVGEDARIRVEPPNASVTIVGHVVTSSSYSDLTIDRESRRGPLRASVSNTFDFDGHIAAGETQKYYKPVLGFALYAGSAIAGLLEERGIAAAGDVSLGTVPLTATPIWQHRSRPLAELVHEMLVDSNNHTAEQLLRTVGERAGRGGSDAAGVSVERHVLDQLHVTTAGMRVYDGSGLSPSDRIPALTLAQLLVAEYRAPVGHVYLSSLPRVGLEGTVRHHDLHDALGRVRAKSGHIHDVNALAGLIATAHHGRVAFAFEVNDPRSLADVVTISEDRAMDVLAEF